MHTAQPIPLPLTFSCSSKSRLVLPFWNRLTEVVLEKRPLNGCSTNVCQCVSVRTHNSKTTWPNFTKILSILPVVVARSSSDGVAICYVFSVLWMTFFFISWANGPELSTTLCLEEVCQVAVLVGRQSTIHGVP